MQKQLHESEHCGKLYMKGERLICPVCGRQTQVKLLQSTVLKDFPIFCKHCKAESIVNIDVSQNQSRQTTRVRAD